MTTLKWLAAASLAVAVLPALYAEAHCPGNVASIRPRFDQHSIVIVPVMVNGSGPYDFVLDTGAQLTIIDPALALELHLKAVGATHIIGAASYTKAAYAQPESLQTGSSAVREPLLLIDNLGQIQTADPQVRGILGENFLEHFDLLIDYIHGVVCLDDTRQMQEKVKGEPIALIPPHTVQILPYTQPLIVPVRVSGDPERSLDLELDSGSNAPLLFDPEKEWPQVGFVGTPLHNRGADGVVGAFAVLPPRDIRVGANSLHQISFVTPVRSGRDAPRKLDVDGVLPTALFRRVFLSYKDHFALLDPR